MTTGPEAGLGPDIALVGAARCATSFLAAYVAEHPYIDEGAYKEPNFFSREYGRGPSWYDGLYGPRRPGYLRLDASTSYTSPLHPKALSRLASSAPAAYVVYAVRDPLRRAVSHYHYCLRYIGNEAAPTFGAAIRTNPAYLGASDYQQWLSLINRYFPAERVLVVPFPLLVDEPADVVAAIYSRVGLPPTAAGLQTALSYRNETVSFRNPTVRAVGMRFRRSRVFPIVRRRLGLKLLRRARGVITTQAATADFTAALASCDEDQRSTLREVADKSTAAVSITLQEQDERTGLAWSGAWPA